MSPVASSVARGHLFCFFVSMSRSPLARWRWFRRLCRDAADLRAFVNRRRAPRFLEFRRGMSPTVIRLGNRCSPVQLLMSYTDEPVPIWTFLSLEPVELAEDKAHGIPKKEELGP